MYLAPHPKRSAKNMSSVSKSIRGSLLLFCTLLLLSCEQQKSTDVNVNAKEQSDSAESTDNLSSDFPEPEIIDFEEFTNYGTPIDAQPSENLGIPESTVITESWIGMPVFTAEQLERFRKNNGKESKQADGDNQIQR